MVGLSQADAEAAIVAANLTVGTVTTQNSATVPAGDVISQDPPTVERGGHGHGGGPGGVVGSGAVTVPDVVGLAQADAEAAIVAANLTVGTVTHGE